MPAAVCFDDANVTSYILEVEVMYSVHIIHTGIVYMREWDVHPCTLR